MADDAYVTMLLSDDYLLGNSSQNLINPLNSKYTELVGAQVLAASLRDGGTTKKLAVIVPADEAHRLLPQTTARLEVYPIRHKINSRIHSTLSFQCRS